MFIRNNNELLVMVIVGAVSVAVACSSSGHSSGKDTTSSASSAPGQVDQSSQAGARRDDLFVRALRLVRPPAKYRLDDRATSGDSIVAAIRRGAVANVGIFTGAPGTGGSVSATGPRRPGDVSCYGAFDHAGMPSTDPARPHEDAAVLFIGSCDARKPHDAKSLYRVGTGALMTEAEIRARVAQGSPLYLVDDSLTPETEALALLDQDAAKRTGRRAFTIFTYFAEKAADGGVVEIGTRMPAINP